MARHYYVFNPYDRDPVWLQPYFVNRMFCSFAQTKLTRAEP